MCFCCPQPEQRNQAQARTYDYYDEDHCDKNMAIALKAVEAAKDSHGFAAVKVCDSGCARRVCFVAL